MERIIDSRLKELGFKKKLNIWRFKGISVQKYKGHNGIWKACKGLSDEVDLETIEQLKNYINQNT